MKLQETIFKGLSICRGIAIGKPHFLSIVEEQVPRYSIETGEVETEIRRYRQAVAKAHEEILLLQQQLRAEGVFDAVNLLDAQVHMLQDPDLNSLVEANIKKLLINSEAALKSAIDHYEERFNLLTDSFFRGRFTELQDISRRIMGNLRKRDRVSLAHAPANSIVFSKEITTSDTAEAYMGSVVAFVTERGGVDTHAAIVAKARGTPYVSNIGYSEAELKKHDIVIVDGRTGDVILSPSKETLIQYQQLDAMLSSHLKKLECVSALHAETYDGYRVRLSANIEMVGELEALHQYGGEGVGLFRSEYICLKEGAFPSEEEQFHIYKNLVQKMKGLPIVIRTFDIGGDKGFPGVQPIHELNPYLGCRAIRFLLRNPEIFKAQLGAILRASVYGDVSILFPMVTTLSELVTAKKMLAEVRERLVKEGHKIEKIRVGCMIEVPSAAIIADQLALECDFLSIGTNDLVQYALAVDRGNHLMNELYTPTHPSVLRLIKLVIQEANLHSIPVTVCGEIAADPRFTALLLGMGVNELSVATRYLPIIKHAIRSTSIVEAGYLAEKVFALRSAEEIQELLSQEYKVNVPDDCFYNY